MVSILRAEETFARKIRDLLSDASSRREHDLLGMYRDLIALRRNLPVVTRELCGWNAHIFHFCNNAKMLALHRWNKQGRPMTPLY
jgi:hypothetical protein